VIIRALVEVVWYGRSHNINLTLIAMVAINIIIIRIMKVITNNNNNNNMWVGGTRIMR